MSPLVPAGVQVNSWLQDDERTLANDVLDGLTKPFKELSPKHLYDARGSELFERICELPEYYPTRTELAILRARAAEIVALTGAGELVELGAGASIKARVLLDAMRDAGTLVRYVPLDVSESVVEAAARALTRGLPGAAGARRRRRLRTSPGARSARWMTRPGWSRCWAARSATSRPAPAAGSWRRSPACSPATITCCSAPICSRTAT